MNEVGGFRKDLNIALTGLDIEAKAQLVDDSFWLACPYDREDFDSVTTRIVRSDKPDPSSNEEAVALWHLTLKDRDEAKVGRAVANAAVEIALSSTPGFFNVGSTTSVGTPFGVYRPALVPAELVPQYVTVLDGERAIVDSVAPKGETNVVADAGPSVVEVSGPTMAVPLGRLCGARSGDKGGNANVGIFARSHEGWAWLDGYLSVAQLRRLLPETEPLVIDRYRLPALRSLNFVIHGLLEEGVAASTRQDAQAKGLGEWLRSRVVDIPTSLLASP
jgi:hypothetical protein